MVYVRRSIPDVLVLGVWRHTSPLCRAVPVLHILSRWMEQIPCHLGREGVTFLHRKTGRLLRIWQDVFFYSRVAVVAKRPAAQWS